MFVYSCEHLVQLPSRSVNRDVTIETVPRLGVGALN